MEIPPVRGFRRPSGVLWINVVDVDVQFLNSIKEFQYIGANFTIASSFNMNRFATLIIILPVCIV